MDKINCFNDNFFENSGYDLLVIMGYDTNRIKNILVKSNFNSTEKKNFTISKSTFIKTLISVIGSFSSALLGIKASYAKDNVANTATTSITQTAKRKMGKSLKENIGFDFFAVIQAMYVVISSLENSKIKNKNKKLTKKVKTIEKILGNSFIFTKDKIMVYIIGSAFFKSLYKKILNKNKKEENLSFKNTLLYHIAEESPEVAINLLLLNLFSEKRINILTKTRGGEISIFQQIITYVKIHKVLILTIALISIFLFLIYIYRETIWDIYYNLNYSRKKKKSNSLPAISTDLNPFRSYPSQEQIDRESLEFWDNLHLDSKIILMKDGLYPKHLNKLIEEGIFSESDIRKIIINNISNSTSQKLKEYLGIQEFLKFFLQIEPIKNFIIDKLNGKNFDQFIQTILGVDYIEWLLSYEKNIDILKKEILTLIDSPHAKDYQTILSLKIKRILIEIIEKFLQDYKSEK
jgi:hypothetical protein